MLIFPVDYRRLWSLLILRLQLFAAARPPSGSGVGRSGGVPAPPGCTAAKAAPDLVLLFDIVFDGQALMGR